MLSRKRNGIFSGPGLICAGLAVMLTVMLAVSLLSVNVTVNDGNDVRTLSVMRGTLIGRALSDMGIELCAEDTTTVPVTFRAYEDTEVTVLRKAQQNPDFGPAAQLSETVLSENTVFYAEMKAKEEEIRQRREQLERYRNYGPAAVTAVINDDGTMTVGGRTYEITDMIYMEATAYCPCEICCGIFSSGYTADGSKATQGHTVATSSAYPFGTLFYIPYFDNIFEVEDRGGAIQGNRIDIYYDTHEQALGFGRKDITVYIIKPYVPAE